MITRRHLLKASAASVALAPLAPVQHPCAARRKTQHPKSYVRTFANTEPLEILPYTTRSSQILVHGFKRVRLVTTELTLHNLTHALLGPVSFLLVAPGGRNVIPFSDVVVNDVNNVTLTLTDAAEVDLPAGPPLVSGSYRPRNFGDDTSSDFNPQEVPPISGDVRFSTFYGIDPNGVWSLHVYNANSSNPGLLAGGWSLQLYARSKRPRR